MCQYRAVGHPIATAVTEGLVDLAAARDRHGPAGDPPPQPHRRRRLSRAPVASGHQVRGAVAPRVARPARRHDGLRRRCAPSRSGCARRASIAASALPRFIEVTNPSAAFYGIGGARISAQDGVHGAARRAGRGHLPDRRHRAGPGRRSRHRADRGHGVRRADRARARHHRRHRQHALWRRHLGLARAGIGGEAAWQAGKALRANVLAVRRRRSCRPSPRRSTSATAWSSTAAPARARCRSPSSPASPISAPTRCRPASRPS